MNNGPTPISSSTAGTRLGQATLRMQQDLRAAVGKKSSPDEITDTLETTDREADGRQTLRIVRQESDCDNQTDLNSATRTAPDENCSPEPFSQGRPDDAGSRLDLLG